MVALLPLLLGCSTEAPRELRVAGPAPEDTGAPDTDDTDTADDTGPVDTGTPATVACGGSDGWSVEGGLDVDWCVRVTPEPGTDGSGGGDGVLPDTGADTGPRAAPPPCGFTNLVGAVEVAGQSTAPALLYCDADADGGMRLAQVDTTTAEVRYTLLAAGDCAPTPGSGAIVADGDGFVAAWAGFSGAWSGGSDTTGGSGVAAVRLDAAGAIVDGPARTNLGASVDSVALVGGDNPVAIAVDYESDLWLVPLGLGLYTPEPERVFSGVESVAGAALGDGLVVAACGVEGGPMTLLRFDAERALVATVVVAESACGWFSRPSLAVGPAGITAGWNGNLGSTIVGFDADLAEVWRYTSEDALVAPTAVGFDSGWLVLTGGGELSRRDAAGEALATTWHPGFVDADGSLDDIRLAVDGDQAVFVLYGMDSYTLGAGHVNAFNYLEISAAPVP